MNKLKTPPAHFKLEQSQKLWKNLQYTNTPVTIYRSLVDVLGSVKSAVLLSQMIYWTRVGVDVEANDGWFRKSIAEFTVETGLSVWEQETARRTLKDMGIIETKHTLFKGINTPWVRVNLDSLSDVLAQAFKISAKRLSMVDIRNGTDNFKSYLSARVPYHTALAKIAGGVNAGLMLTCYIHSYFKGYNKRFEGYVTRGRDKWLEETGLSYKEQLNARRLLISRNLIFERNMTLSRHIDTSINLDGCFTQLMAISSKSGYNPHNSAIEKRASQSTEKGFSVTGKRAHIELAKGLIPERQKVSYVTGESAHNWLAKPTVYNKEQITNTDYSSEYQTEYPDRTPQPPLQTNEVISENNSDFKKHVVVGQNEHETEKQKPNLKNDLSGLIWSNRFSSDEIRVGRIMLKDLGANQAQEVLDEIEGATNIRNPISYLRTLAKMAKDGTFIAEKAGQVKAKRTSQTLKPRLSDEERAEKKRQWEHDMKVREQLQIERLQRNKAMLAEKRALRQGLR